MMFFDDRTVALQKVIMDEVDNIRCALSKGMEPSEHFNFMTYINEYSEVHQTDIFYKNNLVFKYYDDKLNKFRKLHKLSESEDWHEEFAKLVFNTKLFLVELNKNEELVIKKQKEAIEKLANCIEKVWKNKGE